jgi:primosomal protein N' (replication factor Y) (superfamily II helicase)
VSERVVDVALPLPVQATFSYRVPESLPLPERGVRVLVPFGVRRVVGLVTGAGRDDGRALKDVLEVVDEAPLLTPPLLDLAQWVSEHYLAPPGECYRLLLPPAGITASRAMARLTDGADMEAIARDPLLGALREKPLPLSALARRLGRDPSARLLRLRREGLVVVEQDMRQASFRLVRIAVLRGEPATVKGKGQAEVVSRLRDAGGRAPVPELLRDRPGLRGALTALTESGAVAIHEERIVRVPDFLTAPPSVRPEPSPDQARALESILPAVQSSGADPLLLHGVTGSGKTEVYFRAAETALAAGRGALFLVPEIGLTPMLVRAAVARFGPIVSVLHSELSAGERHDQWWRIREGEAQVVVGARSAVFAPLVSPGLIVVDEEHDGAYKQEESPRYHARDVAVMRGRLEGVPVILGSATPSVETFRNSRQGKYRKAVLPTRIGRHGRPRVEVVDRRAVMKAGGDAILSPPLREALEARVAKREQSLLLLNRRGYATSLLCRECGEQAACPNCSVSLTLHDGGRTAICHYCAYQIAAPRACGVCKGAYLRLSGFGTEKVLEAVRAALPQARVERLDRDLAVRRGAVQAVLAAFEKGDIDVLVGTQMIAKGHDFPRVTLVGVIDADVGLGLPDFRSAERTFQLLTQVAGRAGRAELAGEVILQSHLPDHYSLMLACEQDYEAFFEVEIEFRRTMAYPPEAALVNLILRARDPREGAETARALAEVLRAKAQRRYRVLGPATAPLARLRQEHRFQVLLKGSRPAMRDAVREALVERYGAVRWPGVMVDVDPVSVM